MGEKKPRKGEWLFILLAHLVLLAWIFYALSNGGALGTGSLLLHFFGMALYGALLIPFTAWWAKK